MNDSDDETLRYALGAVAGVVALVLAGVIALAASTAMNLQAPAGTQMAAGAGAGAAPAAEAPLDRGKLYFESGSAALPAEATGVLSRIAETARARAGSAVLISGFHDASGDPAANAELAKNRALAVRHALEANGVAAAQLVMDKPAMTEAAGDPKQARRVEVRVQ